MPATRDSQVSEDEPSDPSILKNIVANNQAKGDGFKTQHVVAYILTAVLAREYSGWQHAMDHGLGLFGIAQFCTAFGNLNYYLCLAEIWSAIPFSGGSYALSRTTLGFYWGFLDGSCEAIIYVIHAALSAEQLGDKIVSLLEINPHYTLVFIFIFFVIALTITIQKSLVVLRRTYMIISGISILIVIVFCFGSMHWSDFNQNASLHKTNHFSSPSNWFQGGFTEWITILPATLLPYAGTRSYAILTSVTEQPKTTLPRAIVIGFSIVFLLNMMVIFINASQPGGIEHTARLDAPMGVGWQLMFKLKSDIEVFQTSTIFSLPSSFGKMLAYILPGGLLFFSMGKSNLLPSFLYANHSVDRTMGSIVLVTLSMIFCIFQHFFPEIDMYMVLVMMTKLTDCSFLYGYVLMKTRYSTLEREFKNPFGIPGAVFAFVMFVFTFLSAGFYQGSYFPPQFMVAYFGAGTVYYFLFAKRTETLCEEEDRVFLKIHVRNYNIAKKRKKNMFNGWKSKTRVAPGNKYRVHSSNSNNDSSNVVTITAPRYANIIESSDGSEFVNLECILGPALETKTIAEAENEDEASVTPNKIIETKQAEEYKMVEEGRGENRDYAAGGMMYSGVIVQVV